MRPLRLSPSVRALPLKVGPAQWSSTLAKPQIVPHLAADRVVVFPQVAELGDAAAGSTPASRVPCTRS